MNKRSRASWQGYIPAITTPFDVDRNLDLSALGTLLEWLHSEGMHGLLIAGTTGEWPSMSPEECKTLFSAAGNQLGGKLPLLAGCTAFTAERVLDLADHAADSGFDGIVVTPPPYYRPLPDEIFGFYRDISARSRLPICVYNWPPGTGIDMPLDLLKRIAGLDNVVAIKQSTSDLRKFLDTFFALKDELRIFGHAMDEHGLALLESRGGDGTMGAGGVLGRIHADFYNHLWAGDIAAARECGRKDRLILDAWYTPELVGRFGSGPAILKAALNVQGLPGGYVRPPLQDVSAQDVERIRETLATLGRI
ncbi:MULTISPECIES: dihydrodipicolinate synthase family protein [Blastomonas]|jgi:dihydrodipicolinate synthase/N-acetylneuraminate lyase|uniref:Dihydrodipicolinate synthase family protein n=1 Tax=Blastomonas fulva TaxID=1550728 RepID=A0ABN5B995_9SPHN|nr:MULTISPECIES: dihydrodipicolinate synthase family protein [Blastomonas]AOG01402.1 dihydrodipicolinate synthetase family protein [Blastomonas sp. RAC04]ASR53512.1 dihydrodipicolinate synthase family protein [Blastomonas fulva]KPF77440.1 dihydrodipicolinate synthetase [Blastomonas sp. AAP25]MDK2755278.1 dihydrodipicolinate synthase family protein [Blastomonas fulva]MDM7929748.1 dihydrodipicolinate synthase family protein [Blastomonas fulva]